MFLNLSTSFTVTQTRNDFGFTPFLDLCNGPHWFVDKLELLLQRGSDIDERCEREGFACVKVTGLEQ